GGPLVRNRLYYFLSAQQAETRTNIVDGAVPDRVAFLPVAEERTESKLFGKLTWEPDQNDRLAFVLGWDDVETENRGLDSFTAPEAGQTQESPGLLYSAAWQRVVSNAGFFELKITGFDASDDRLPQNGDRPAVRILDGDRELFGNAIFSRTRDLENTAASASWDALFEVGGTRHSLVAGLEVDRGTWLETRRRNGGFTWRPEEGPGPFDPEDPSTWGFISSDWGGDIRLDAETRNSALYLQDDISLGERLTVSLGLRYADWQGEIIPGFSGGPSFEAVDADGLAPRLGAIWDTRGDGRLVAKAHYGRYYQSLFALMFDRAEGTDAFQNTEFWDWDRSFDPDLGQTFTTANREDFFFFFDDIPTGEQNGPVLDYDQPFVDQIVLGLETAIGENGRLAVTYVHRENEDILALVDRNLDSNYTLFRNVRVFDFRSGQPVLGADGSPLVLPEVFLSNDDILFVGSAPGLSAEQVDALSYDPDLVLTNADDATRELDQVQVVYDHRTGSWSLNASLVWTDLVGNFFSVSGYENAFGTGAGSFVEPNLGINAFGTMPSVAEWEFKLRLSGDLPWGLRGGLYFLWATGDTFTPSYTLDSRNHDFLAENGELFDPDHIFGVNGQALFLEPRGSREREDFSTLDLFVEKEVELGAARLRLGVDVFNLFNEDAELGLVTEVNEQDPGDPSTLFGAVRSRQTPRTVRLNATLRF
ncbi:MAG: TonB-dependent receptor, partial [Holophagales bacterium]|nr:TonB-dependent receptor [Holophagales bacterium]